VINDNNYPGTGGRDLNSDNTEFLELRLDRPLAFEPGDGDEEKEGEEQDDGEGD